MTIETAARRSAIRGVGGGDPEEVDLVFARPDVFCDEEDSEEDAAGRHSQNEDGSAQALPHTGS